MEHEKIERINELARKKKTVGLTEAELRQVLMHVAIYGGVPAANHAFALAKELGWGEAR